MPLKEQTLPFHGTLHNLLLAKESLGIHTYLGTSVWPRGTQDPRAEKTLGLILCGHFNNQLIATEKNYEFLVRQKENKTHRLNLVLMCPFFHPGSVKNVKCCFLALL